VKLRPEDRVGRFVLRLALWLPPCFAAWYLLAGIWLPPLAMLVDGVLQLAMPDTFRSLSLDGREIVFDTQLVIWMADGRSGSPTFALNPLSYSWNLPVLAALLLAGPTGTRLPWRLLLGYLLLLPAWAWGLCSQFAKTVVFDLGPEIAAQVGEPGAWLDLLALAYQFGVLILPATALVLAWVLLGREDLQRLAGIHSPQQLDGAERHTPRSQRRQGKKRRQVQRRGSARR